MDANTATAVCATAIATVSLAVSVNEARATRRHNRLSVTPALALRATRVPGGQTGISLRSAGLGPAIITSSSVTLDGEVIGRWRESEVNALRGIFPYRTSASTFDDERPVIPVGHQAFLLSVREYDTDRHADFWHLIRRRLGVVLEYQSFYGGHTLRATFEPAADESTGASLSP